MARLLQSWTRCKQLPQLEAPDLRKIIREELQVQQHPILEKLESLTTKRRRGLRKVFHSLKKQLLPWMSSEKSSNQRKAA